MTTHIYMYTFAGVKFFSPTVSGCRVTLAEMVRRLGLILREEFRRYNRKLAEVGDGLPAWLPGLLLVMATLLIYQQVDKYPFIHTDDHDYVTGNAHVRSGINRATLKWALTTYDAANWHPLTWLSHALDCQLFGLNPARHHDVNVILHALNVALLFWVLVKATGFPGRSFFVAALFAFHPMNVESVAWIAERKTLLSMMFFLLALGAYGWYARRTNGGRYFLVAVLYGLALLSKPQAITLPCVLLLWDYWPLKRMSFQGKDCGHDPVAKIQPRPISWLILEKLPLLALSAVSAKLTIAAQFGSLAQSWFPLPIRIENAVVSYARYIQKAIWPANLAFLYPHPLSLSPPLRLITSILLLLGITALVVAFRQNRSLTVGWLWFLGTLVPMIGLVQVGKQAMADRYAYLPFIGLFIMICWSVSELAAWNQISLGSRAVVGLAAVLALALLTHRQISYWANDEVLWVHTLHVTNQNWGAEDALGTELWRQGRMDEAAPYFLDVLKVLPYDYGANVDMGTYEAMHGDTLDAIKRFKIAAGLDNIMPADRANALNNLGQAYLQLRDYTDARESFGLAVRTNPRHYSAWVGLGVALQKSGRPDLAARAYYKALQVQTTDWVWLLLARALEESGHRDQAEQATERAKASSHNINAAVQTANQVLGK